MQSILLSSSGARFVSLPVALPCSRQQVQPRCLTGSAPCHRTSQHAAFTGRARLGVVCSASPASYSGDQAKSTPEKGYAFLHDFCLTIPYGIALTAIGAVTWLKSSTTVGTTFGVAGLLACAAAGFSLKCFEGGKKSTPFTVFTAAFFSWQNVQAGVAKIPSLIALLLSGSIAAFLVYNVAAGGNPPKGEKPLAEAAPHPVS